MWHFGLLEGVRALDFLAPEARDAVRLAQRLHLLPHLKELDWLTALLVANERVLARAHEQVALEPLERDAARGEPLAVGKLHLAEEIDSPGRVELIFICVDPKHVDRAVLSRRRHLAVDASNGRSSRRLRRHLLRGGARLVLDDGKPVDPCARRLLACPRNHALEAVAHVVSLVGGRGAKVFGGCAKVFGSGHVLHLDRRVGRGRARTAAVSKKILTEIGGGEARGRAPVVVMRRGAALRGCGGAAERKHRVRLVLRHRRARGRHR